MDATQVDTFCDAALQLLPALAHYASIANDQRSPEDEALVHGTVSDVSHNLRICLLTWKGSIRFTVHSVRFTVRRSTTLTDLRRQR